MTEVTSVQPQQPGRIDNEKFPQIIRVIFNELITDEGVCRTAPATPGLLIRALHQVSSFQLLIERLTELLGLGKLQNFLSTNPFFFTASATPTAQKEEKNIADVLHE